jgi:hypothetical protein
MLHLSVPGLFDIGKEGRRCCLYSPYTVTNSAPGDKKNYSYNGSDLYYARVYRRTKRKS